MKRKIYTTAFIICLFLAAADAIGLFFMRETVPEKSDSQLKYVFLASHKDRFWLDVARGVKEADRRMGSDTLLVHYKEKENIGSYIKDAILSGAEGIIIQGNSESKEAIQEADAAGIPVLFFDNDNAESGRTSYVGKDNEELGCMAAQALIDIMGTKGDYLLILSSMNVYSQHKRREGIEKILKQYPSVSCSGVIEHNADLITLRLKLEEELKRKKPDGIITLDGITAVNLGELLPSYEISCEDIAVVVTDLTDETIQFLERGSYDAVITLNAPQIGYRAVEVLNQYYTVHRQIQDMELINSAIVTKDNLSAYVREKEDEEMEWNSY